MVEHPKGYEPKGISPRDSVRSFCSKRVLETKITRIPIESVLKKPLTLYPRPERSNRKNQQNINFVPLDA